MYRWQIEFNGQNWMIKADKVRTAVFSVLKYENVTHGKIIFKQLSKVKKIMCNVCHGYYDDDEASIAYHLSLEYHQKKTSLKTKGGKK